jgi:ribonucleoside-diphosphate reductase alpha chain
MIKTSVELAKEKGKCQLFSDTKYSRGILPIDTYNKNVDELIDSELKMDWESLRADILKYGMRNSTLMANAPFGSSSVISNSTPGIEPPRDIANLKRGVIKLVPDIKYKNYYTTAWAEDFNNEDYFKFVAVLQKFMDQTISTNEYYNLLLRENGKVKKSELINNTLVARYYGIKTLYYLNIRSVDTKDGDDLIEEDEHTSCDSGGCEV